MSRKTLAVEYDYDFVLIGILCQEKDYRLCHELNHKLNIELKKEDNLEITLLKQKETHSFSLYTFGDETADNYYTWKVVANKGTKGFLIPEQKQVNFFMMITGGMPDHEKKDVIRSMKEIAIVMGAFEVNPEELKSKENLLFD